MQHLIKKDALIAKSVFVRVSGLYRFVSGRIASGYIFGREISAHECY